MMMTEKPNSLQVLFSSNEYSLRSPDVSRYVVTDIATRLEVDQLIPYCGPELLNLCDNNHLPTSTAELARRITDKIRVPHRLTLRLGPACQYIENFKHRKTLVKLLDEIFSYQQVPSKLHAQIATSGASFFVNCWYDGVLQQAISASANTGFYQVQGQSQSEHFGHFYQFFNPQSQAVEAPEADFHKLLYQPLGTFLPLSNYIISDSDYVEILTEIDIQTPIPEILQWERSTRGFLFVGCRFDDQLKRSFARQIMKRSADPHFAVVTTQPTRMQQLFLKEQSITPLFMTLTEFSDELTNAASHIYQHKDRRSA